MKKILLPALALMLFAGCYPDSPDYTEVYDLVISNYDKNFDFKSQNTYALPDSVIEITGESFEDPDGNGRPDFVDNPTGNNILNAIRNNMNAYGWTEVSKDSADVVILPSAMKSTTIVYYYDWYYWDWYYPYGGYGWYYPGYYPSYATTYTTGTIFTTMIYPDGLTPDHNMPAVWSFAVNGLLTGSNTSSRITSTVAQAFEQSPYLQQ